VSQKSREVEFSTSKADRPLIVQFAANNVQDFVSSAQLVSPFCNGVDLNCGCPQRWALKEGIGACLIEKPEFVSDLVRQTRNQCRDDLLVSIKIRLHSDVKKTIDLCRQLEKSGVHFVSIHGRTKDQKSEPVNLEAIKAIKETVQIPVVANGDIKSLEDVWRVKEATNVDGVMAARGILENPAMYAGYSVTPKECVESWLKHSLEAGTAFPCFHHHLSYMLERVLSRSDRRFFNSLNSAAAVIDYLDQKYDIKYK
jgi:tRNA-dihydrouridine synthase 4